MQSQIMSRDYYLSTKPERVKKQPFEDREYVISFWSSMVHDQDLDKLLPKQARILNAEFVSSIDFRLLQFRSFLERHSISVNLENNDYQEFELFIFDNIDSHPDSVYADTWCSEFWSSIMVDFVLYIVDYKKRHDKNINFHQPNYTTNGIYGNFIQVQSDGRTYPIFNIFVGWANKVASGVYSRYRYESLSIWVQQNLEGKEDNEIVKPQRLRKLDFQDYAYPLTTLKAIKEISTASNAKKQFSSYLQERKQIFYDFLSRHDLVINIAKADYVEFEVFAILNMDFDESNQSTMTDFWRSLFIDFALVVAKQIIKGNQNIQWYFNDSPIPLLVNTKKKQFNIIESVTKFGDIVANNRGYISQPNTRSSLRGTIARGVTSLDAKLLEGSKDYLLAYQSVFHYHYYEAKPKTAWYYNKIE